MVNQLSKFEPHIAECTKLRDLPSTKNHWTWGEIHQPAFSSVENSRASTPTLARYDASRQTKLSTDATSYGLGAVLLQNHDDQWRPVAYATSPTKQR